MQIKTWDKSDLLPKIDSKEYKQLLDELEKNTKFIEDYRTKLNPEINIKEFMSIFNSLERIDEISRKLGEYAYLWFSEDTSEQEAKSFRSKVEQLSVNIGNRIMYFGLWFKNLDDKNALRIINGVPNDYKYYLEYIRILRHHVLTEPEEKIINIKDVTGTNALIKIYDVLTNDFVFKLKVDGKELKLVKFDDLMAILE